MDLFSSKWGHVSGGDWRGRLFAGKRGLSYTSPSVFQLLELFWGWNLYLFLYFYMNEWMDVSSGIQLYILSHEIPSTQHP